MKDKENDNKTELKNDKKELSFHSSSEDDNIPNIDHDQLINITKKGSYNTNQKETKETKSPTNITNLTNIRNIRSLENTDKKYQEDNNFINICLSAS